MSKVAPYDEEIKSAYNKYKTEFNKFSDALKKYKPKREIFDISSISNPDERASAVMLNAYGNILDGAEEFYESFEKSEYKGDYSDARKKFENFETVFNESKKSVMNSEFSEKTKFMKYNFEDYFSSTADNFLAAGKKFFEDAPAVKNENEYKNKYNDVVEDYNNMINSYNTSIGTINRIRAW